MIPEEVPEELKVILDRAAGKDHSATGAVMSCLAEILTVQERAVDDKIAHVLEIARDGTYDGGHHKAWVIDQMVRALTNCPWVIKIAKDYQGQEYEYTALGESPEYRLFVESESGWDVGIAP